VTLFKVELNFLGLVSAPSFYSLRLSSYIESQGLTSDPGVVETLYRRATTARSSK
jgi:hypothetical protein